MKIALLSLGLALFLAGLQFLAAPPSGSFPVLGATVTPALFSAFAVLLVVAGAGITLASAALLIVGMAAKTTPALARGALSVVERRYESRLRRIAIDATVLRRMHEVGQRVLGDEFIAWTTMQEHFAAQPAGFACWESIADARICAFYIFVPLNRAGTDLLLSGRGTGARSLKPGHLCRKLANARALYLTELYGDGFPYSGIALARLKAEIQRLAAGNRSLAQCLAKPASPAGRRLMRAHGFVPIAASPIWVHPITAGSLG